MSCFVFVLEGEGHWYGEISQIPKRTQSGSSQQSQRGVLQWAGEGARKPSDNWDYLACKEQSGDRRIVPHLKCKFRENRNFQPQLIIKGKTLNLESIIAMT